MNEPNYMHFCSDCAYFKLAIESDICSPCIGAFNKAKWKDKNEPEHACDIHLYDNHPLVYNFCNQEGK